VIPSRRVVSVRQMSQRSSASIGSSTAERAARARAPSLPRRARGREDALNLVLELAHVAGPRIGEEQANGVARETAAGLALARRVEREEVLGEREDVLAPRAQRRHRDR
jgi:hypothetical protein